jgi:hypothetical protein
MQLRQPRTVPVGTNTRYDIVTMTGELKHKVPKRTTVSNFVPFLRSWFSGTVSFSVADP